MITQQSNVLITGASDGLGKTLAILIAQTYGCNLAICGRNDQKLRATLSAIHEIDPAIEVFAASFDCLDEEACRQFAHDAGAKFGGIDILINNAGANLKKDLVENINTQDFREMLELNCVAPLVFIQECLPHMKQNNDGMIINILSSACKYPAVNSAAYGASKQAMEYLHQVLLKEEKDNNIHVVAIYPGGIDTNFRAVANHDYLKPETVAKMILNCMENEEGVVHELLIRAMVENNF